MSETKPKLTLKRKTIANLSNAEMSYVYGGDGDDEPTRRVCGKTLSKKEIEDLINEAKKKTLSNLLLIC